MPDVVCKNCCFAAYKDDTQESCSLDILKKFEDQGNEILECYDEEKAFYVVKDKVCPYQRSKKWYNKRKISGLSSKKRIKKIVRDEIKYNFSVLLFVDDDETKLERTLESLKNMKEPFTFIHIFRGVSNKIHPQTIKKMLEGHKSQWKIYNLVERIYDKDNVIYKAAKSTKTTFLTVLSVGENVQKGIVSKVKDVVIDDLGTFGMIKHIGGYTIPMSVFTYWYYEGDPKKETFEKIEEFQCQNQDQNIVVKL